MRGSDSVPSSAIAALTIAAIYLLVHFPFLAPSLEDIDSINFALGLRDYNIAQHQPHPPGYPVYIALGRASRAVIALTSPLLPATRADALALAIWSALGGALALIAAWSLFGRLERRPTEWSTFATLLLAVLPAFWMTGLRPMSDMAGLAIAMTAQALLVRGLADRQWLVAGALAAGLAAGIRVQTICLTLPLLVVALGVQRRAGALWLLTRPVAALAVAGLVWAVPMVVASGGVGGYLEALGSQAGEDFAGVQMLLFNPTPRRLAYALYETFVLPVGSPLIASVVLALAALGAGALAVRDRRAFGLLALAFAPYTVFHLLLQETSHVRYALPVLPAVAWLAISGARLSPAIGRGVVMTLIVMSGWVSLPAGMVYGGEPHPVFRAIDDMATAIEHGAKPAALYSHFAVRRPLQASPPRGVRVVEPRRSYEWMDLVDYWVGGGREPVWFLADPLRSDLALIDPHSRLRGARSLATQYRWSAGQRPELGGVRPTGVDWYRFDTPPGWFAAEGWALTPETGGLAKATTMGVDREPIDAYVRRGSGPLHAVIGVRHLGDAAEPPTVFTMRIDDAVVQEWTLDPANEPNDLRFIELPNGLASGPGDFAHLSIAARSTVPGRPTAEVAVRQFDIQAAATIVYGFGEGWHEAEYDNASGLSWRWTSERSVIRVAPARSVRLTMRGESPLNYVDAPPRVRITAAGRDIAELRPDRNFSWTVNVPAAAVVAAGGAIAIETDKVYLPGPAEGTADARRLGLRLFELRVEAGSLD